MPSSEHQKTNKSKLRMMASRDDEIRIMAAMRDADNGRIVERKRERRRVRRFRRCDYVHRIDQKGDERGNQSTTLHIILARPALVRESSSSSSSSGERKVEIIPHSNAGQIEIIRNYV